MSAPTPIRSHAWERDPLDWYVEPAWCVDGLLDCETFEGTPWDPACGLGTIPKALDRRGIPACASDILVRDECRVSARRGDFLMEYAHGNINNIVTNPPFRHAVKFAIRALSITPRKVAILQRQNFLGSQGRGARCSSRTRPRACGSCMSGRRCCQAPWCPAGSKPAAAPRIIAGSFGTRRIAGRPSCAGWRRA